MEHDFLRLIYKHRGGEKNVDGVLMKKPQVWKPLERPRSKREDNIRMDIIKIV
jgi:hypothetical protein